MEWPFWPVKDEIHQDVKPKIEPPPNEVHEEKENQQVMLTLKDSEYTENIKLEQNKVKIKDEPIDDFDHKELQNGPNVLETLKNNYSSVSYILISNLIISL